MRLVAALTCLLCSLSAFAAEEGRDIADAYARGYAQSVLDREFAGLGLQTRAGSRVGHVLVVAPKCLGEPQKLAITQKLLSATVKQVEWEMPCPEKKADKPSDKPKAEKTKADQEAKPKGTAAQATVAAKTPPTPTEPVIEVEPLPAGPIFDKLIADPREPRFSVTYEHHKTSGDTFDAGGINAGEFFIIAEGKRGDSRYQFGIQGGVFALFNLDTKSMDLLNADYLVGFPVTWRKGSWSARGRLYHQSSHLGDEFLLDNPGIDRVNLSYEVVDGLVSHDWKDIRVYGGGGAIINSEPNLKTGLAQLGMEYEVGTIFEGLDLTLGADFKSTAEQEWHINRSLRAGLSFTHFSRNAQLLLLHYRGFSPNGQFFTDRLQYYGFGVHLGF